MDRRISFHPLTTPSATPNPVPSALISADLRLKKAPDRLPEPIPSGFRLLAPRLPQCYHVDGDQPIPVIRSTTRHPGLLAGPHLPISVDECRLAVKKKQNPRSPLEWILGHLPWSQTPVPIIPFLHPSTPRALSPQVGQTTCASCFVLHTLPPSALPQKKAKLGRASYAEPILHNRSPHKHI